VRILRRMIHGKYGQRKKKVKQPLKLGFPMRILGQKVIGLKQKQGEVKTNMDALTNRALTTGDFQRRKSKRLNQDINQS
jgi:hypothetical protein